MGTQAKLVWLHLPSLTVDRLAHPNWRALSPTHQATLVAGFPWWPWTVHASMCTGLRPSQHGCLERNASPTKSVLVELAEKVRCLELEDPPSLVDLVNEASDVDLLHLSAVAVTPASAPTWAAVLGELLRWKQNSQTHLLVTGDRPMARVPRRVPRAMIPQTPDLEVIAIHERVALLRGTALPAWRDEVLSVAGVDRILEGRGLELFGASADRLVAVVLGPSMRFDEGADAPPSLLAPESDAVILGWGSESAPPWTDAVHDYRVAATLLAIVANDDPRASARGAAAALRF